MNGNHNACEFPEAGALTTMVRFFRHYVAGTDNGWQKTPHIIIDHEANLNGTPSWISAYNSWSQVMKPVTLYFQRDRSLATTPTTKRAAGSSPFSGPQPSQSGRWAKRPAPGSFVTYTSPPLAHDVDVFGPGSVNIWVSSTVPTPDIEAIISEVRPDGMEQYVQAGWLNLAQRKLAPAGTGPGQSSALAPYQTHTQTDLQPLTSRTRVYARLQLLPFEHVFQKGSSIRITLNSADGPVQASGGWVLLATSIHSGTRSTPARSSSPRSSSASSPGPRQKDRLARAGRFSTSPVGQTTHPSRPEPSTSVSGVNEVATLVNVMVAAQDVVGSGEVLLEGDLGQPTDLTRTPPEGARLNREGAWLSQATWLAWPSSDPNGTGFWDASCPSGSAREPLQPAVDHGRCLRLDFTPGSSGSIRCRFMPISGATGRARGLDLADEPRVG